MLNSVCLDFHKGRTALTLEEGVSELQRPKKLGRALKAVRKALGLAKGTKIGVAIVLPVTSANDYARVTADEADAGQPWNSSAPELTTFAGLLKFLEQFTGSEGSIVTGTNTVKELVSALNANSFGNVSAAVYKIGPPLSQKVKAFLRDIDLRGEEALPTEAKP